MFVNKQIKNTFYTLKRTSNNQPYNIIYCNSNSFFDSAMQNLSDHCLVTIDINNKELLSNIFYSALWINDILDFSQKIPYYANFYTNYILALHGRPSQLFKREDLTILANSLSNHEVAAFSAKYDEWLLSNIRYIPYGVIRPDSTLLANNIRKDILIINLKQQKQTNMLYQYLKNHFPETDMLTSIDLSIRNIHSILSKYKICIDFDHYYNLIVANSCGAYGITSLLSEDEHIYTTNNSNQIIALISSLFQSYDYQKISDATIQKYNWDRFITNMCDYTNDLIYRGFIV